MRFRSSEQLIEFIKAKNTVEKSKEQPTDLTAGTGDVAVGYKSDEDISNKSLVQLFGGIPTEAVTVYPGAGIRPHRESKMTPNAGNGKRFAYHGPAAGSLQEVDSRSLTPGDPSSEITTGFAKDFSVSINHPDTQLIKSLFQQHHAGAVSTPDLIQTVHGLITAQHKDAAQWSPDANALMASMDAVRKGGSSYGSPDAPGMSTRMSNVQKLNMAKEARRVLQPGSLESLVHNINIVKSSTRKQIEKKISELHSIFDGGGVVKSLDDLDPERLNASDVKRLDDIYKIVTNVDSLIGNPDPRSVAHMHITRDPSGGIKELVLCNRGRNSYIALSPHPDTGGLRFSRGTYSEFSNPDIRGVFDADTKSGIHVASTESLIENMVDALKQAKNGKLNGPMRSIIGEIGIEDPKMEFELSSLIDSPRYKDDPERHKKAFDIMLSVLADHKGPEAVKALLAASMHVPLPAGVKLPSATPEEISEAHSLLKLADVDDSDELIHSKAASANPLIAGMVKDGYGYDSISTFLGQSMKYNSLIGKKKDITEQIKNLDLSHNSLGGVANYEVKRANLSKQLDEANINLRQMSAEDLHALLPKSLKDAPMHGLVRDFEKIIAEHSGNLGGLEAVFRSETGKAKTHNAAIKQIVGSQFGTIVQKLRAGEYPDEMSLAHDMVNAALENAKKIRGGGKSLSQSLRALGVQHDLLDDKREHLSKEMKTTAEEAQSAAEGLAHAQGANLAKIPADVQQRHDAAQKMYAELQEQFGQLEAESDQIEAKRSDIMGALGRHKQWEEGFEGALNHLLSRYNDRSGGKKEIVPNLDHLAQAIERGHRATAPEDDEGDLPLDMGKKFREQGGKVALDDFLQYSGHMVNPLASSMIDNHPTLSSIKRRTESNAYPILMAKVAANKKDGVNTPEAQASEAELNDIRSIAQYSQSRKGRRHALKAIAEEMETFARNGMLAAREDPRIASAFGRLMNSVAVHTNLSLGNMSAIMHMLPKEHREKIDEIDARLADPNLGSQYRNELFTHRQNILDGFIRERAVLTKSEARALYQVVGLNSMISASRALAPGMYGTDEASIQGHRAMRALRSGRVSDSVLAAAHSGMLKLAARSGILSLMSDRNAHLQGLIPQPAASVPLSMSNPLTFGIQLPLPGPDVEKPFSSRGYHEWAMQLMNKVGGPFKELLEAHALPESTREAVLDKAIRTAGPALQMAYAMGVTPASSKLFTSTDVAAPVHFDSALAAATSLQSAIKKSKLDRGLKRRITSKLNALVKSAPDMGQHKAILSESENRLDLVGQALGRMTGGHAIGNLDQLLSKIGTNHDVFDGLVAHANTLVDQHDNPHKLSEQVAQIWKNVASTLAAQSGVPQEELQKHSQDVLHHLLDQVSQHRRGAYDAAKSAYDENSSDFMDRYYDAVGEMSNMVRDHHENAMKEGIGQYEAYKEGTLKPTLETVTGLFGLLGGLTDDVRSKSWMGNWDAILRDPSALRNMTKSLRVSSRNSAAAHASSSAYPFKENPLYNLWNATEDVPSNTDAIEDMPASGVSAIKALGRIHRELSGYHGFEPGDERSPSGVAHFYGKILRPLHDHVSQFIGRYYNTKDAITAADLSPEEKKEALKELQENLAPSAVELVNNVRHAIAETKDFRSLLPHDIRNRPAAEIAEARDIPLHKPFIPAMAEAMTGAREFLRNLGHDTTFKKSKPIFGNQNLDADISHAAAFLKDLERRRGSMRGGKAFSDSFNNIIVHLHNDIKESAHEAQLNGELPSSVNFDWDKLFRASSVKEMSDQIKTLGSVLAQGRTMRGGETNEFSEHALEFNNAYHSIAGLLLGLMGHLAQHSALNSENARPGEAGPAAYAKPVGEFNVDSRTLGEVLKRKG